MPSLPTSWRRWCSRAERAVGLSADGAPSARLVAPRAPAARAYPSTRPPQLGSGPGPRRLASARDLHHEISPPCYLQVSLAYTLAHLLDRPQTRAYLPASAFLQQLLSPLTELEAPPPERAPLAGLALAGVAALGGTPAGCKWRLAPHRALGPLLRTPERRPSPLEARRGPSGPGPQAAPKG